MHKLGYKTNLMEEQIFTMFSPNNVALKQSHSLAYETIKVFSQSIIEYIAYIQTIVREQMTKLTLEDEKTTFRMLREEIVHHTWNV